jgi:hypothetical protein
MANGGETPLTNMNSPGLQASAQAGMTNAPQAGGNPLAVPDSPTYGGTSGAPLPGALNPTGTASTNAPNTGAATSNPYGAFLQALSQIQSANPAQSVAQVTPNVKPSQGSQQATMRETGVG